MEERSVTVTTPARLHMGFVDMNGALGRNFGSLGLSIADIRTRLTVSRAGAFGADGPCGERALAYARAILEAYKLPQAVAVHVQEAIPEHVGLGSGTQLALAVSAAIDRLFGLHADIAAIASVTARGMRSGIGIGVFTQGGFIVDGGRGRGTRVPPVVGRVPFPERWRIALIFDRQRQGLHGAGERQAFEQLPSMPAAVAGELCRRVLMQVLPALLEEDFGAFCEGVTTIQDVVGDQFAAVQGGRYTSPLVAEVLAWLKERGVHGFGQSSWGPTGFALFEGEEAARATLAAARQRWQSEPSLTFTLTRASNTGAEVQESARRRLEVSQRAAPEVNRRAL